MEGRVLTGVLGLGVAAQEELQAPLILSTFTRFSPEGGRDMSEPEIDLEDMDLDELEKRAKADNDPDAWELWWNRQKDSEWVNSRRKSLRVTKVKEDQCQKDISGYQ